MADTSTAVTLRSISVPWFQTMAPISTLIIMKFQIGDIVLILHSNEEAEVVDIINDKMVMVDAGGVQFPVYKDQIDFPYLKRFMEKKNGGQKKTKTICR